MSYITFNNLGASADLGSQVQQYASMYAIAKETGKEIVFPESQLKTGWGIKFQNLLNVPFRVEPDSFFADFKPLHPTDGLLADPAVFKLDPNTNYIVTNLFHLYHYWYPKYAEEVYDWNWNPDYLSQAAEKFLTLKQADREMVALHVRRGDYLKHDHFCKLDTDYYGAALEPYLQDIEKYHFLIFSNDIEWCKENLIEGDMVTFVEQGIDYVDLITMSMCDHFIIANSSFSWWAAYRSYKRKSKPDKVTCPTNYIRNYSPFKFMNGNYYPPTWKNIDNNDR